jgi:hypothetical protein
LIFASDFGFCRQIYIKNSLPFADFCETLNLYYNKSAQSEITEIIKPAANKFAVKFIAQFCPILANAVR